MIPKKEGLDTSLDEKLDSDLKKAEEKSKEKIANNKPKLASALSSRGAKIIIFLLVSCGIAYKMFFSVPEEKPKKKKNKSTVSRGTRAIEEANQKAMASSSIGKAKDGGGIEKQKSTRKVLSVDDQTLSNSEALSRISVPKLSLPEVPSVPTIDKITIETMKEKNNKNEGVKDRQNNGINRVISNNGITNVKTKESAREISNKANQKDRNAREISNKANQKDRNNKKRKLNNDSYDNEEDNISKNSAEQTKQTGNNVLPGGKSILNGKNGKNSAVSGKISNQSLSKQLKKEVSGKVKNSNGIELSSNALEQMFVLNGKGPTITKKNSGATASQKDFILFDGASISEKQVVQQEETAITKITNLENTIAAGKIIEAVLETAINSESAGTIRAVISKDVLGESGNKILIPRGSRVYGSYATTSSTVQTRLLLTWNKVIRPDGVVITMNADTYDQSGKKGIEGDIDTRYGELFKNSLMYSFVTLGTAIALEKIANIKGTSQYITGNGAIATTNVSPANAAAQSVIATAQDIAKTMTDGLTDDLDPVISIPQGLLLKIISNTDIVVPVAYKRRVQDIAFD